MGRCTTKSAGSRRPSRSNFRSSDAATGARPPDAIASRACAMPAARRNAASDHDYGFDLELGALGQRCHTDGGACRIRLWNDVGHDGIGATELAEIGEKQRELDDVVERAARRLDDGLQIGEGLAHLPLDR